MVVSKKVATVVLAFLAILFYYFIYPTPYLYVVKNGKAYRVSRYSGREEMSSPQGWVSQAELKNSAHSSSNKITPPGPAVSAVDVLRAWEAVDFITSQGSVSEISANNPTKLAILLKIDAPVAYYTVDKDNQPLRRIFSGKGTISEQIPPGGIKRLTVAVAGKTGYPQSVLNRVRDGEKVLQRVTISVAAGETADGTKIDVDDGTSRDVDRVFTPYPVS